jgi:apolipoprotein N-acyltransferase
MGEENKDQELTELELLQKIEQHTKRTSDNVVFFFWVFILGVAATIFSWIYAVDAANSAL